MKLLKLLLVFMIITKFSFAQQDTVFFDKNWNECSSQGAMYYRLFSKEDGMLYINDYYGNGKLQMKAQISENGLNKKNGKCCFYAENGKMESKGIYQNNTKIGIWTIYDKQGNDSSLVEYFIGEPRKEIKTTDEYLKNETFISVEVMPEFPGGQEAMFKYLQKSLKYPYSAKKENLQGTVYIGFVINQFGAVEDVKVARGVRYDLDETAKKVVEEMPTWKPGTQNDKAVKVAYTLPIKFKL
jgi:TonB family protein